MSYIIIQHSKTSRKLCLPFQIIFSDLNTLQTVAKQLTAEVNNAKAGKTSGAGWFHVRTAPQPSLESTPPKAWDE